MSAYSVTEPSRASKSVAFLLVTLYGGHHAAAAGLDQSPPGSNPPGFNLLTAEGDLRAKRLKAIRQPLHHPHPSCP